VLKKSFFTLLAMLSLAYTSQCSNMTGPLTPELKRKCWSI